jgi:hypothetical protein
LVDLVRFGVSIYLTCEQKGWNEQRQAVYTGFLAGYRTGLDDPKVDHPEPALATRIRAGFTPNRPKFLTWAESLMKPLQIEQSEFDQMVATYAEQMRKQDAKLGPGFFRVKKSGSINIGVGSALDEKYLMRVEGPTTSAADDIILEAKEVRPPSGASCVHKTDIDPFRILLGQSRIAYRPYLYLGYTKRGERMLWVHEWMEQYEELTIERTITSASDLRDVAHDVGIQLGRGHPNQIAAPLEVQVRARQLSIVNELEPRIIEAVEELTQSSIASWQRFRDEVQGR